MAKYWRKLLASQIGFHPYQKSNHPSVRFGNYLTCVNRVHSGLIGDSIFSTQADNPPSSKDSPM